MHGLIGFLIVWVVTAISFLIISKLPIGVEIDNFGKAMTSAALFGILNAVIQFLFYRLPSTLTFGVYGFFAKILSLGLFSFILTVIAFGLAAALVEGFRLRWGILSAILGAIALSIVNSILFRVLLHLGARL